MPSGAQLYIYGLVTGGAFPTSTFANGQYASVTDADGYMVAALAITTSNANSYTTQTAYYAIGGVSASDYSSYTASYGSNPASGASSASDTFSVVTAGSLVVVVAIGGDEQSISVSGVPGVTTDATNFNGACNQGLPPVIVIGHAYPNPGTYTVTEQTTQCAAGQDPNHAGDLIGVFVFSSQQSPTTSQLTPTTTTVNCSPTTIMVQSSTTCTATVTGSSPTGTVTFSSSSSTGSFTPPNAQCTLLSASCSVPYSDTSTGTPTITGSYGGDMNNDASSGVTTISVASGSTTSGSFDFGLDNSGPITLSPGASGSDIITAILVTDSASPVSLSCNTLGAPLPAGVSCSFNPPSVTPTALGATSSLIVSTAASTPPGSYAITVFGTAGEVTRNTVFTLTVGSTTSSLFDFHLACAGVNSCEIVVAPGSSGNNLITAMIVSGSAQPVSLSCTSGLPTDASCSFNPESGTPTFTSVLTVSTTPSTPTGSYRIGVTANGGGVTHTITFYLLVNGATSQSQSSCGSPTITLSTPQVNGLSVTVNGVTLPGASSCSITSISWSWGDGQSSTSWFPASYTYASGGTYAVQATTHQSDGQTAVSSISVTVGETQPSTTLTFNVFYQGLQYQVLLGVSASAYAAAQSNANAEAKNYPTIPTSTLTNVNYVDNYIGKSTNYPILSVEITQNGAPITDATIKQQVLLGLLVYCYLLITYGSTAFVNNLQTQQQTYQQGYDSSALKVQIGNWATQIVNLATIIGPILQSAGVGTGSSEHLEAVISLIQTTFGGYGALENSYGQNKADTVISILVSAGLIRSSNYNPAYLYDQLTTNPQSATEAFSEIESQVFSTKLTSAETSILSSTISNLNHMVVDGFEIGTAEGLLAYFGYGLSVETSTSVAFAYLSQSITVAIPFALAAAVTTGYTMQENAANVNAWTTTGSLAQLYGLAYNEAYSISSLNSNTVLNLSQANDLANLLGTIQVQLFLYNVYEYEYSKGLVNGGSQASGYQSLANFALSNAKTWQSTLQQISTDADSLQ